MDQDRPGKLLESLPDLVELVPGERGLSVIGHRDVPDTKPTFSVVREETARERLIEFEVFLCEQADDRFDPFARHRFHPAFHLGL
jgi:hypothetical protein